MPKLANYKVITEFGRSIFTKRGISLSLIETVKDWGEKRVAMAHFGSNQFVREVYTVNWSVILQLKEKLRVILDKMCILFNQTVLLYLNINQLNNYSLFFLNVEQKCPDVIL